MEGDCLISCTATSMKFSLCVNVIFAKAIAPNRVWLLWSKNGKISQIKENLVETFSTDFSKDFKLLSFWFFESFEFKLAA